MENDYDIWISNNRRIACCVRFGAAYDKKVYPKYYPAEVVVFFCELHSKETIKRDIENGYVSVLKIDGNMIGTGCFEDNHITRVYVLPEHQKMGYGTFIIKNIADKESRFIR